MAGGASATTINKWLDDKWRVDRVLSRIFRLGEKSFRVAEQVAEGQEYSRGVQIFGEWICAKMQSGALKYL